MLSGYKGLCINAMICNNNCELHETICKLILITIENRINCISKKCYNEKEFFCCIYMNNCQEDEDSFLELSNSHIVLNCVINNLSCYKKDMLNAIVNFMVSNANCNI